MSDNNTHEQVKKLGEAFNETGKKTVTFINNLENNVVNSIKNFTNQVLLLMYKDKINFNGIVHLEERGEQNKYIMKKVERYKRYKRRYERRNNNEKSR